jgi:hypothetical protein
MYDPYSFQPAIYINQITTADADGDGIGEIYMGLSNGVVKVYNGFTFQEMRSFTAGSTESVKIGDVDNDGKLEAVLTTANLYDGVIQVWDGKTHVLKRQSTSSTATGRKYWRD